MPWLLIFALFLLLALPRGSNCEHDIHNSIEYQRHEMEALQDSDALRQRKNLEKYAAHSKCDVRCQPDCDLTH